jgi:K+-transporting ATPase ATPase A chain
MIVLLALAWPLGLYMARVFDGPEPWLVRALGPLERVIYRVCGVKPREQMGWKRYAVAMLAFQVIGLAVVYALQRVQGWLPLDPQGFGPVDADSAFNTAASFVTNTNWQGYAGEAVMSYATQMVGLAVQNFVSAASGIAVLVALIRGIRARGADAVGNFWVDLVKSTVHVLLPLSLVLAVVLVSQGVVQNFSAYQTVPLVEGMHGADGKPVTDQVLPMGPAASRASTGSIALRSNA